MAGSRAGSILAVDFGNVNTRAILIDLVDGVYRLVAQNEVPTTAGFPVGDVSVGLKRVLEQMQAATGRRFIGPNGRIISPEQPDRSGVDVFLTTASIGRPLRTVLLGLVPEVSIASATRATAGTYIQIVETIDLDDRRSEEDQINAIVLSRPDLVFITGGTEDGARDSVMNLANTARMAMNLTRSSQRTPTVLFAGNSALTDDMRALFEDQTRVLTAPNVRPSLEREELEAAQLQLALAFDASAAQRGSGFEDVGDMSRFGVLPTAQSYNLIVDYLGQALDGGVLAVDVGSAVSILSGSHEREINTVIRTDIGMGHSAQTLVRSVKMEAVRNWLPFNVSDAEIDNYVLNKSLRPGGIPETLRTLYIEHALYRAGVAELAATAAPVWGVTAAEGTETRLPPFGRIIGAGATLNYTGRPGLAALLLLDALQPTGVTTLQTDPYALVPALGALARLNPGAVVQVIEGSGLVRLGLSFSLSGTPRVDKPAMRVTITPESGGEITQEIDGGHLWIYPLTATERARVEVRALGRGTDINGKNTLRMEVSGGLAGLVFDARGRPLPIADDVRGRALQLPMWMAEVTGDDLRPINPAWLEADGAQAVSVAEAVEDDAQDAKKSRKKDRKQRQERRAQRGRRGKKDDRSDDAQTDGVSEGDELDELRDVLS